MQFMGHIPPNISLQSWIRGHWIGKGLEITNIQYLARGQIACMFTREGDKDMTLSWGPTH
eukprot:c37485_g1_i1 orf=125-304(+)